MSGVIDSTGQQWEPCHVCGKHVRFPQDLGYVKPTLKHICIKCVTPELRAKRIKFGQIIPAPSWKRTTVNR